MRLRLRELLGGERGSLSLVELVTVTLILGIVLAGLTTLFVQGSNAELDLNLRFQAQQNARLALDKLRREAHCASVVAPTGASASITVTLPASCTAGSGPVSWCTVSTGTGRYGLYRKVGASCDSAGVKWADYLTASSVFNYTAQSTSSLATLHVDFPVNVRPSQSAEQYELVDDIVLRNSTRS